MPVQEVIVCRPDGDHREALKDFAGAKKELCQFCIDRNYALTGFCFSLRLEDNYWINEDTSSGDLIFNMPVRELRMYIEPSVIMTPKHFGEFDELCQNLFLL